jgi:RNA-directed DNA polymerase
VRFKGAAGVDRVTINEIEQYGVGRFLQELGEVLRAGEYGAQVVRRAYIPKTDGAKRPLGIPTVQDRVRAVAFEGREVPSLARGYMPDPRW